MKTPKIAIVISHPIQHFCPQFVNYAKSDEWRIKVFFASNIGSIKYNDPDFKRDISWGNLNLDKFEHEFLNGDASLPITTSLDAVNVESKLLEFNPDAVLVFGYAQKIQRRAYNWAKKNDKYIIYFSDSELRQKRSWYKKILKRFYLNYYFKHIHCMLTIGDANENYYRHYGVPDIKLLRAAYPIDIDVYDEAFKNKIELNEDLRNILNIPLHNIVITVVGKLVSWKRQIDIINAIKLLDNKYNKLTALIIGTGTKAEEWKKCAKEIKNNQIIFTDFVDAVDLPKYYAATDIYIHPSEIEPHSVAISEAIFMGCPVIISDLCGSYGPNDDVQIGSNGFVYRCGDIDELSQKIEKLINDKKLRKYFRNNSKKYADNSQERAHVFGLKKVLYSMDLLDHQ